MLEQGRAMELGWSAIPLWVVLGLVVAAAVSDYRLRRIPNALVIPGALLGLLLHGLFARGGPWSGVFGLVLGMVLTLPFYALRAMGAGDVKLMGMVGAFVGPVGAVEATLLSFLAGGVIAVAFALRSGQFGRMVANLRYVASGHPVGTSVGLRRGATAVASVGSFPYGVAIAVGTSLYVALRLGGVLT